MYNQPCDMSSVYVSMLLSKPADAALRIALHLAWLTRA
jgi:hypothetical protein